MGGTVNGLAAPQRHRATRRLDLPAVRGYMRGSVRLSALTGLPVAWVYTHDSVDAGRGQAQPATPSSTSWRCARSPSLRPPAPGRRERDGGGLASSTLDATSTGPWPSPCRARTSPSSPTPTPTASPAAPTSCATPTPAGRAGRHRGGGPHRARRGRPAGRRRGPRPRRLHAELGALRGPGRRLPRRRAAPGAAVRLRRGRASRSAGTAGSTRCVAIDRFGASAPGPEVLERLGITPEHVAEVVRDVLAVEQEA